ncbi:cation-transporting P-type ATPase [Crenothrix sp.]
MTQDETCSALNCTEHGLSAKEAQQRSTQYGLNKLTSVDNQGVSVNRL